MEHLVYCDKKAKELDALIHGKKTMIVRGAQGRKHPHGRVYEGEKLFFVENDGTGKVKASGVVVSAIHSLKLSLDESVMWLDKFQDQLQLTDKQLDRWRGKKYLCLVEVKNVQKIEPFYYQRSKNMDDWISVESIDEIRVLD